MKDERNSINAVSSSTQSPPPSSEDINSHWHGVVRRRSFLKGLGMAGTTLLPAAALLMSKAKAEQGDSNRGDRSGSLTRGDAAILRFLGAAEILESDLWIQYWELGGTQDNEFATATEGNATPLTDIDPVTGSSVTFLDLTTNQPESLQANLIMSEPTPFLSRSFPICSIIRPTNTKGAAMGAARALMADGLFIGQTNEFIELITDLAADADRAQRRLEG